MDTSNCLIEMAVGGVANRHNRVTLDELPNFIKPKQELYRSMFIYDDSFDGHITNYEGTYEIDRIFMDIDIKDGDIKNVQSLAHDLNEEIGDELFQIWFSGTGFHIEVADLFQLGADKELPVILKLTIKDMFQKYGVDNIYDRARLIRCHFSYNKKNGSYKIPISYDELMQLKYNDILEIAKSNEYIDLEMDTSFPDTDPLWKTYVIKPKALKDNVDSSVYPSNGGLTSHVTCVQKMYNQGETVGKRHAMLLRIASAWKRSGIPQEGGMVMLRQWATSFSHEELERIVNSVYSWEHDGYGCKDVIMDEFCDPRCRFFKLKDYGIEVYNAKSMSQSFLQFVKTDFSDKCFDLADIWKLQNPYRFYIGELVTLIGDTKLGKTAFVQNLIVNTNKFRCLYLSLEVNKELIYRRFGQIAMNETKFKLIEQYNNENYEFINECESKLKHLKVMTVSPELNNLIDVISQQSPKMLVIDTIDEIRVDYANDPLVKMQKIVSKLKEIAQTNDIMIFVISHISKSASYEGILDKHSAKGDSAIEQKSDKLLGITAPSSHSKARVVESIAARDESNFKLKFWFNHETFRFDQVVDKQVEEGESGA